MGIKGKKQPEQVEEEMRSIAEELRRQIKRMGGPPMVRSRMRKLDEAIDQACAEDIETFVAEVYKVMLAHDVKFLVRAQLAASRYLTEWGENLHQGACAPPKPLVEELIPHLERVEKHVLKLVESCSKTLHTLSLARESAAVRGTARKLREEFRVLAHPVIPAIEEAAGPEQTRTAG